MITECPYCELNTAGEHAYNCLTKSFAKVVYHMPDVIERVMTDDETDLQADIDKKRVLRDVDRERQRQDAKWGQQNHNAFTWLAILGEEVGESNQAALKAHFGNKPWVHYREELIQVAAVAVAMVECLDRHNGEDVK